MWLLLLQQHIFQNIFKRILLSDVRLWTGVNLSFQIIRIKFQYSFIFSESELFLWRTYYFCRNQMIILYDSFEDALVTKFLLCVYIILWKYLFLQLLRNLLSCFVMVKRCDFKIIVLCWLVGVIWLKLVLWLVGFHFAHLCSTIILHQIYC